MGHISECTVGLPLADAARVGKRRIRIEKAVLVLASIIALFYA